MTSKGMKRKPGETVKLIGTTLNADSFSQQVIANQEISGSTR